VNFKVGDLVHYYPSSAQGHGVEVAGPGYIKGSLNEDESLRGEQVVITHLGYGSTAWIKGNFTNTNLDIKLTGWIFSTKCLVKRYGRQEYIAYKAINSP
jgi:hypothetical protein